MTLLAAAEETAMPQNYSPQWIGNVQQQVPSKKTTKEGQIDNTGISRKQ